MADEHQAQEQFRQGRQAVQLEAGTELRLEIGDSPCSVQLESGSAEIQGAVVQLGRRMQFVNANFAVYTHEGCVLTLWGQPRDDPYKASDPPMTVYVNAAAIIENKRRQAFASKRPGPRVVVVGPPDSGKSTLCLQLLNYAVRCGRAPVFVDTDVSHSITTIPGTISAVQVNLPVEADEGLTDDAPLVLFYGHTSPTFNAELYKVQVKQLAEYCTQRDQAWQRSAGTLASGIIINTMGGIARDLQSFICRAFHADVVLVLGDEKLHSALQILFQDDAAVEVVKLPASGGCVSQSREHRKMLRDRAIARYFHLDAAADENALRRIPCSSVKIYRTSASERAQSGLLPAGFTMTLDPCRVSEVTPAADMEGQVLAVSTSDAEASKAPRENVAGFVWVQQVDVEGDSLSIYCPNNNVLPAQCFMMGDIKRSLQ